MILEERKEQIIYQNDAGEIITVPNSDYYWMKHIAFKDSRVGWIFSTDCYLKETFDDRIFNCWCYGERLQLRQDLSDELCGIIRKSIKKELAVNEYGQLKPYDGYSEYVNLFGRAQREIPNLEFLRYYLEELEDVKMGEGGCYVRDDFLIDYHGNASMKVADERSYKSVCLVMRGNRNNNSQSFPMKDGSFQLANPLTMTILSKVMFILNPNLKDRVFTQQLSKEVLNRLRVIKKEVNV